MDQLGVTLATITGLRVFDFPPDTVSAPAAVVGWPSEITYDSTMQRGADEAVFEVHVLVGRVSDRSARDALAAYLDGSGSKSVKVAIEAGTVGDSARVRSAAVSVMTVSGMEFLAATFDVHVIS
jgi:hypothetical protein